MSTVLADSAPDGNARARGRSSGVSPLPWPAVLHDIRGAATAIDALAGLAAHGGALPPETTGLLEMIRARAEQLGTLCEAGSALQGRAARQSLTASLADPGARLQNFLQRAAVTLKVPGEIPDRECDGPLGALVRFILVTAVNAREDSQAGSVSLEAGVVNDTLWLALDFRGPGWGAPAREAVRLLSRGEDRQPLSVACRFVLDRMGGLMCVDATPAGMLVRARLPLVPAVGRLVGETP